MTTSSAEPITNLPGDLILRVTSDTCPYYGSSPHGINRLFNYLRRYPTSDPSRIPLKPHSIEAAQFLDLVLRRFTSSTFIMNYYPDQPTLTIVEISKRIKQSGSNYARQLAASMLTTEPTFCEQPVLNACHSFSMNYGPFLS